MFSDLKFSIVNIQTNTRAHIKGDQGFVYEQKAFAFEANTKCASNPLFKSLGIKIKLDFDRSKKTLK